MFLSSRHLNSAVADQAFAVTFAAVMIPAIAWPSVYTYFEGLRTLSACFAACEISHYCRHRCSMMEHSEAVDG
jgi:hypothetical protein